MMVKAQVNTPTINRWLKNSLQVRVGLNEVLMEAVSAIDQNFLTEGARLGKKWQPLKYRDGQILRLTGAMYASVGANSKIDIPNRAVNVVATKSTMRGGKLINIARAHNEGRGVPKREYMKFTADDKKNFTRKYADKIYK